MGRNVDVLFIVKSFRNVFYIDRNLYSTYELTFFILRPFGEQKPDDLTKIRYPDEFTKIPNPGDLTKIANPDDFTKIPGNFENSADQIKP